MKRWPIIRHARWFWYSHRFWRWWDRTGRYLGVFPNARDTQFLHDVLNGKS